MPERGPLDDRTVVARILAGERELFGTLVSRYEKRIVNYVYRVTHRWEEAHDLSQEIFTKVYLALDRYDPKFQFSTWIFRIAQNAAIDALRKKSVPEVSLTRAGDDEGEGKEWEFADPGVSPYRDLKNKRLAAAIDVAVAKLPPDYRELIQLRHFGELSYEEIAAMTKLPLGTVKNKLFRARNLLKDDLAEYTEPI
jgi:RNA polymerase sigma-70 factor (ECF subfamily)